MSTDAERNLKLEGCSGCLFLVFVLLVGCLGLLASSWLGNELIAVVDAKPVVDQIMFSNSAYLSILIVFLIPTVLMGLAILGIRLLLVKAELEPWIVESEPPGPDAAR